MRYDEKANYVRGVSTYSVQSYIHIIKLLSIRYTGNSHLVSAYCNVIRCSCNIFFVIMTQLMLLC